MILDSINSTSDIKSIPPEDVNTLCDEIRAKIIDTVSKNGGHPASSLGAVELTVALHRVFDSPDDSIVFDVGHQSYAHKLLTGRFDRFDTLRRFGGISGFTLRAESEHDAFGCGHASTSISAAIGIAEANRINGEGHRVIAVVGDGAMTGGMIYEALNNCADIDNLIIVLNDNDMSISHSVGGMNRYLARFRTSARYFRFKSRTKRFFGAIPLIGKGLIAFARAVRDFFKRLLTSQNMFEQMGLKYYGPLDGNDEKHVELVLREAANDGKCSVVHLITKKGKGYAPAENDPGAFHGVSGFDKDTGAIAHSVGKSFSSHFGDIMISVAETDRRLCCITAAMADGTGLAEFAKRYPDRFFDVGIAEEHAATFAAGLACKGIKPVFAVYSTFAQRSYDQIIHDICLQNLPVVLALDRAGFVGADGPTHHGLFDVSMLLSAPNMHIFACESFEDTDYAFAKALSLDAPCAVRYARGTPVDYDRAIWNDMVGVQYCDCGKEPSLAIITYGRTAFNALHAAVLALEKGISVRVIKLVDLLPLDMNKIKLLLCNIERVLFVEEGCRKGGVGEMLLDMLVSNALFDGKCYEIKAIDGVFMPVGTTAELDRLAGFDPESLKDSLIALCGRSEQQS